MENFPGQKRKPPINSILDLPSKKTKKIYTTLNRLNSHNRIEQLQNHLQKPTTNFFNNNTTPISFSPFTDALHRINTGKKKDHDIAEQPYKLFSNYDRNMKNLKKMQENNRRIRTHNAHKNLEVMYNNDLGRIDDGSLLPNPEREQYVSDYNNKTLQLLQELNGDKQQELNGDKQQELNGDNDDTLNTEFQNLTLSDAENAKATKLFSDYDYNMNQLKKMQENNRRIRTYKTDQKLQEEYNNDLLNGTLLPNPDRYQPQNAGSKKRHRHRKKHFSKKNYTKRHSFRTQRRMRKNKRKM